MFVSVLGLTNTQQTCKENVHVCLYACLVNHSPRGHCNQPCTNIGLSDLEQYSICLYKSKFTPPSLIPHPPIYGLSHINRTVIILQFVNIFSIICRFGNDLVKEGIGASSFCSTGNFQRHLVIKVDRCRKSISLDLLQLLAVSSYPIQLVVVFIY